MNNNLVKIVKDYRETVHRVLVLLSKNFGEINYILAKNTGEIPKRDFLDNKKTIRYNFHGAGITVDFADVSIVFDFDFHSSNHFGFNAWQLERFIKINPQKYPELSQLNYGELETELQSILIDLEEQDKIEFNQSKNRYYPI